VQSLRALIFALTLTATWAVAAGPAHAGATILVDVDSGKVLEAENATYPWYPASVTKLMTLYVTLKAVKEHRITFDSLFTVSQNAVAQSPTKMGFAAGTQVTVDNALKMMMVKSANDMAVLLAEGIDGSVDAFAEEMTRTAQSLGMTESHFVNPNGLPDTGQITSARDLAILARALIRDFPEYDFYWHIPAIKFGWRVIRNYNTLLGRYPGADGMKTGFICAAGYNLVATATRGGKRLVAVVLGAPSSSARAIKAAELLESGFTQGPLAWLTPALGSVDGLTPVNADPPNLQEQICGPHRRRARAAAQAAEEDEPNGEGAGGGGVGGVDTPFSALVSSLRAPVPKGAALLSDLGPVTPVVVYTGPTRTPAEVTKLSTIEPPPVRHRRARAHKRAGQKAGEERLKHRRPRVSAAEADGKGAEGKNGRAWTPISSSALAESPPPELHTSPGAKPHRRHHRAKAATVRAVAKPTAAQ
jgi:D-alanyl-D-alanine carboxypeptidase